MHYRQLFMVWEALKRVVECQALEVPQMTKDTRAAWLSDYKVRYLPRPRSRKTETTWHQTLLQQAREQVTRLLTTDWLIPDGDRNESTHDDIPTITKSLS